MLAAALLAILAWVVKQVTGEEPVDSQLVANLASTLPPLVEIGIIGSWGISLSMNSNAPSVQRKMS